MELVNGRPEDTAGRLEKEIRTYDFLDSLGVAYQRIDHEAAMTMEACEEIDKMLDATICKNLFLCNRQKTEFYLLLLPGDKPFQTKVFSKLIGVSRLSFADADAMLHYLDITPGSVSILGLMNDREKALHVYIDREVASDPWLGAHPCINTSTLRLETATVLDRFLPWTGHTATVIDLPRE